MPLNQPALQSAIYAAFRRQSTKPGPDKAGVEQQLADDLSAAIQMFILSGTVNVLWTGVGFGIGIGIAVPFPLIATVFSISLGIGTGTVV